MNEIVLFCGHSFLIGTKLWLKDLPQNSFSHSLSPIWSPGLWSIAASLTCKYFKCRQMGHTWVQAHFELNYLYRWLKHSACKMTGLSMTKPVKEKILDFIFCTGSEGTCSLHHLEHSKTGTSCDQNSDRTTDTQNTRTAMKPLSNWKYIKRPQQGKMYSSWKISLMSVTICVYDVIQRWAVRSKEKKTFRNCSTDWKQRHVNPLKSPQNKKETVKWHLLYLKLCLSPAQRQEDRISFGYLMPAASEVMWCGDWYLTSLWGVKIWTVFLAGLHAIQKKRKHVYFAFHFTKGTGHIWKCTEASLPVYEFTP